MNGPSLTRLAHLTHLALPLLLALLVLGGGLLAVRSMLRASAAPFPPATPALDARVRDAVSTERILARNLLGLQLTPAPGAADAEADSPPPPFDDSPPPPLEDEIGEVLPDAGTLPADAPWVVTGVVQGAQGTRGRKVFVHLGDTTRVVALGEELEGWRLTHIDGLRTRWTRPADNGQQETRELLLQRNPSKGDAATPGQPQPLPTLQRVEPRGGRGGGRGGQASSPVTHTPSLPGALPGSGAAPSTLPGPGPVHSRPGAAPLQD